MKTRTPSIIAAVIGSLSVAFAMWQQYVAMHIVAAVPFAAGSIDNRYFWWPLCAGGVFLALACLSFLSNIVSRRKHRHEQAA
jgi:TRAP-type C4-dicarboxylate transport system permease small subunit